MDIDQVVNLGIGGIAVFFMYQLSSQTINNNAMALQALKESIDSLGDLIKNHINQNSK